MIMNTKRFIARASVGVGLPAFGAAGLIALAPSAVADSVFPAAGDESASATINDLRATGYDVRVNFLDGTPNVPLYECQVNDINNPSAPNVPPSKTTVYVNILCPNDK
jgi:hypothetical protein